MIIAGTVMFLLGAFSVGRLGFNTGIHYPVNSRTVGVIYVVWALIAFREFLDRDKPRAHWAKAFLVISAVTAALSGISIALVVNRRADAYISPAILWQLCLLFKGVTIGLFFALLLSGQLSKKKPPVQ